MMFSGEFETHLSVEAHDEQIPGLQKWAEQHGWRCLHIVLARGTTVSQPMLTRRACGHLVEQIQAASKQAIRLAHAGFPVTRVKVEAAPWNAGVPQDEQEASRVGRRPEHNGYFEHHVKLVLAGGADEAELAGMAMKHGAHLSRNALRMRADGHSERFVTQRVHGGRNGAQCRLDALLVDLQPLGHPVLEVEQEYVVYDSNESMEAGWIEAGTPTKPL